MKPVTYTEMSAAWIIIEAEGREHPLKSQMDFHEIPEEDRPIIVEALKAAAQRLRKEFPSFPETNVDKVRTATVTLPPHVFDHVCSWYDSASFGQAMSFFHELTRTWPKFNFKSKSLPRPEHILNTAVIEYSTGDCDDLDAAEGLKAMGWPTFHTRISLAKAGDNFVDLTEIDERLLPIPDHYLTKSVKFPGQVSFYDGPEKIQAGRRTAMKPGRYLQRFYPFLTPSEVAAYAAKLGKAAQLKFATTPEEIVEVYLNGPSSCMAHPLSHYKSSIHPVSVYGDSDLQLAYLVNEDGRITARALVWPEKKLCGRIYGDAVRLVPALNAAGYEDVTTDYTSSYDSFDGARIRKVLCPVAKVIVCPYIDGAGVDVGEDWLVISDRGDYDADQTHGLLFGFARVCAGSGRTYYFEDEDDMYEDFTYVAGYGTCHNDWVEDNCFYCERSDEYYHNDDALEIVVGFYGGQKTIYNRRTEMASRDCDHDVCDLSGDAYDEDLLVPFWDGSSLCHAGPDVLRDRGYLLLSDGDEGFDPEVNDGEDYWIAPPVADPNQLNLPLVA